MVFLIPPANNYDSFCILLSISTKQYYAPEHKMYNAIFLIHRKYKIIDFFVNILYVVIITPYKIKKINNKHKN